MTYFLLRSSARRFRLSCAKLVSLFPRVLALASIAESTNRRGEHVEDCTELVGGGVTIGAIVVTMGILGVEKEGS